MTPPDCGDETAYAKINLALHVRRRRGDGYHDLESLFGFAQHGDGLHGAASDRLSLRITGPFADGLTIGPDNLVLRAAAAMQAAFGISVGAALTLEKNLPVASGIGGGSADAAAALRLLSQLWNIDRYSQQLLEIASQLGADTPACLASEAVFGEGRGDRLMRIDGHTLRHIPLLLVNPGWPLATAEVFARWDGIDRGALDRSLLERSGPMTAALAGRNDLTDAAITLVPEISDVLDLLASLSGVTLARMSGSGATCFALFESVAARDIGAAMVQLAMPEAWCLATALR